MGSYTFEEFRKSDYFLEYIKNSIPIIDKKNKLRIIVGIDKFGAISLVI